MDTTKFKVLWEYAIPSKTKATADDLFRLASMFLSGELSEETKQTVKQQCQQTIAGEAAAATANNRALLDVVLADTAFTSLLGELADLAASAAAAAASGGGQQHKGLRSILDQVDDEDDSADSSAGEEGSEDDSDGSDDDDGEEEEEAKPASAAAAAAVPVAAMPPVVMKGFVKPVAPGGKVEWSGNWALTNEAFEAGDKAKFRYETVSSSTSTFTFDTTAEGKSALTGVATATGPVKWEGSFLIKDATAQGGFVRVDESDVEMTFTPVAANKWTLQGRGSNANGTFTLEGEVDGASRRMALLKHITFHPAPAAATSQKKKHRRARLLASSESDDDVEEGEDELDPTELADLERDRLEQDMAITTKKQRRR